MAGTPASKRPPLWSDRVFQAAPLPPLGIAALLAAAFLASFLALMVASGDLAEVQRTGTRWWEIREGRIGILLVLLAAYLPAERRMGTLAARRNLDALGASLGWTREELAAARGHVERLDARRARWAGGLALLLVPATALLVDRNPVLYLQPWYWTAANVWNWSVGAFTCWHAGILFSATFLRARGFSRVGRDLPAVDLFEPAALAPFARQGLRSAVPGIVLLSFYGLNAWDRGFVWAIGVMGVTALAVATAGLLLPMWGVRERIAAEKVAERARIRAALRGDRTALRDSPLRSWADQLSVADLLAWRQHVESMPAWPVDAATRLRLALYVALPVGSWLGGALVERLLDAALG